MRSRALPAAGLSVVALALATSLAMPASAGTTAGITATHRSAVTGVLGSSGPAAVCASNTAANGDGITSQDFESDFDAYDANGAAFFHLDATCKVKTVDIPGSFSGSPVEDGTLSVNIFKKKPGLAADAKAACKGKKTDAGPNYTVKVKKCTLKKGDYYVTAQNQLDFAANGQWFWSSSANSGGAKDDMWRNPGDGFQTGCTDYDVILNCLGLDYDQLFSINS